jgi:hypothetical protein
MLKRISVMIVLLLLVLPSIPIQSEEFNYVEIFDPKQNKVIKTLQLTPELQKMVSNWIINIEGMHSKIDPVTDDGYAVRIPLDPEVKVDTTYLKASVNAVYIIIPEKESPFFMIFESETKLSCFLFNGDIALLSKALDFKLCDNITY